MKKLIVVAVLVFFAQVAHADYLLKFRDGSAHVWGKYYAKGKEYCTMMDIGEYCVEKKDVAFIKQVPDGTPSSEYADPRGIIVVSMNLKFPNY